MKTIGLIGGMSWESTVNYYEYLNNLVKDKFGGLSSSKILLYSYDFSYVEKLQHEGKWDELESDIHSKCKMLRDSGCDIVGICTNTMHYVAPEDSSLVHIGDATGNKISALGLKKVLLLGTEFTMSKDFYKGRIQDKFNIQVVTPSSDDRSYIHKAIYDELCKGIIKDTTKDRFIKIIESILKEHSVEGVILGCTEIPLLIKDGDLSIPIFDTIKIHCEELFKRSL